MVMANLLVHLLYQSVKLWWGLWGSLWYRQCRSPCSRSLPWKRGWSCHPCKSTLRQVLLPHQATHRGDPMPMSPDTQHGEDTAPLPLPPPLNCSVAVAASKCKWFLKIPVFCAMWKLQKIQILVSTGQSHMLPCVPRDSNTLVHSCPLGGCLWVATAVLSLMAGTTWSSQKKSCLA